MWRLIGLLRSHRLLRDDGVALTISSTGAGYWLSPDARELAATGPPDHIDVTPRTGWPTAMDSPEIAPARGDTRNRTRSAICSGLDSPPRPIATSVAGESDTIPGLIVLTVTPDPAAASARFFAA